MNRILLTTALCAFLAPAAFAEEKPAPVKVPFELLKSRHMVVSVKVNGKGPYRLIFDTGAPTMLVNNKIGKEAGVTAKNAAKSPFVPFGAMGQFALKTVEIGDVKAENVPTIVLDHPTVAAISQAFGPIDGIVGFPFFARYIMTVDYQAKELTFVPNGYKPGDIMQSLEEALMSRLGKGGLFDTAPAKEVTILAPAAQWGFSADKDDNDAAGLTIKQVLKDSPADKAGLKEGDRLLTLDCRWTDTQVDLFEAASPIKPGKTVLVKVKRGDKEIELKVTPKAGL
jgi:hypothetical protein